MSTSVELNNLTHRPEVHPESNYDVPEHDGLNNHTHLPGAYPEPTSPTARTKHDNLHLEDVGGSSTQGSGSASIVPDKRWKQSLEHPDKIELREQDCPEVLGFAFPALKKWRIIAVIFAVQVSMNFNAGIYGNAIPGLQEEFGLSAQAARVGQAVFLICYAFGCELWAPWSEELGRKPILQWSLAFVNLWQIPCAVAPNYGTIIIARILGGFSSAGGSVTLGMVADLWGPDEQHSGLNFVVLSSVGGSVVGPIVGAFAQDNLSWHWIFWLQLIFGGAVQALHFFLVPETRSSVLVDREAKRRRKAGEPNVYGPGELKPKLTFKEIIRTWVRPFDMFINEPIVLCLSLLSGFADALIFTFISSYGIVYARWGFGTIDVGLAFIALLVGYLLAYFSMFYVFSRAVKLRRNHPQRITPEHRLWWLLWTVYLLPAGLFGFAWSCRGPEYNHWIVPMIFSVVIAIANFTIYMTTIDYMTAAYGPYAASATGGNGFARDFLAGIAVMYSTPLYTNVGSYPNNVAWATMILAFISICVSVPVYVFYWKGPQIRAASKFAQKIANAREENEGRIATLGNKAEAGHLENADPQV
ncbi:hypothetical protein G7K_3666-t1 [Saitoella complicata NRRL Y-17804]|uniref:Major facilitator superfamily (MFS) profile domain-containing protein n=1 Tax=Saitoella complicata (strain BCRC 22490 / CBS 7301 / JCM 7358 / NBRC 10748 / NRRL Y-17804) TaxID=698492 RepID=A0A0E9NI25_SAICN|nr:hypothetical protein G7K_3666-t1 [Saitoella complicata NRRL Y-17804]